MELKRIPPRDYRARRSHVYYLYTRRRRGDGVNSDSPTAGKPGHGDKGGGGEKEMGGERMRANGEGEGEGKIQAGQGRERH